jgi:hypothetical protein
MIAALIRWISSLATTNGDISLFYGVEGSCRCC